MLLYRRVFLYIFLNSGNGVHYGGMISSAKSVADLGVRNIEFGFHKEHGNVASQNVLALTGFAANGVGTHMEVRRDGAQNHRRFDVLAGNDWF